ncbi:GEVED domain-containing protein [Flavobacterium sp.]|uniref:GEVED domain-containing protein n=1 Tax=Flavobacterium sp. TaxID=239 RepID=UPI00286A1813|nr:GEVED domain-containing protein [Flavobacterium sp.]
MKNKYTRNNVPLLRIKILTTILFFICAISSVKAQSPSNFTTSGTWICPAGVTTIQVEAYGGGGGGGYGGGGNGDGGGGGGGGAYRIITNIAVTPGTPYTITVGSGGAGGSTSTGGTANGSNGTASTAVFGAITVTANPGFGGNGYNNTPTGGAGGAGGTATGGTGATGTGTNSGGGGGGAGTTGNGGSTTTIAAGTSGGGNAGAGGLGSAANTAIGLVGGNYGGGGSGGTRNSIGGDGAGGYIRVTFTCLVNTIAAAGTDQTLTACTTTATLAGNAPTYGTGTWTLISGTATITSPNSPTSTITGIIPGTPVTLRWTIDNGRCGSTIDDVIITSPIGAGCWNYCTPSVAILSPSVPITSVSFNTINNASTGTTGYENFSSISTTVTAGYSYTLTVLIIGLAPNPHYTSVWFDWNNNGTFGAGEETQLGTNTTSSNAFTTTITIPSTAVIGNTRMRVINRLLTGYAPACGPINYGQYEDYTLNIVAPPACITPTAQPTALVLAPSGTSLAGSFTAASPSPNNYLVYISQVNTAPTLVNGNTYSTGAFGAGFIVDLDSNTSFVATGLNVSTLYYVFVFSYNSICSGTTPTYFTTSPLTGSTTTLATSYCIPTGSLDCTSGDYIANVTFNTLNNSSTCAPGGYINYPVSGGLTTTLIRGNTFNLSISTGPANKKHGAAVWIDFNQNGVFDTTEYFLIGNNIIANSTNTIAVAIPVGATLGQTRMRIRYAQKVTMANNLPCTMSGSFGETEDYTVTISTPIACVAPSAQPTALLLNATETTITGNFTAASPAPNNYLVVYSTSPTTPTPVNGTSYTIIGGPVPGGLLADNDANTSFVISGLSTTITTYYIFVFSYNSICTGGPTYNLVSPLTGNVTTIANNYCTPTVTSGQQSLGYFSEVSFIGTLNDTSNFSTYSLSAPWGYQDFTGLSNIASQAQGQGVNVSVQAINSSYLKAWVDWDKDGDFNDGATPPLIPSSELVYDSGIIGTGSATFGFVIPANQPVGNYRVRIRANSYDNTSPFDANSTNNFNSCGNINYPGETEDYIFTVVANCNAIIATVTDGKTCGTGTVDLEATSSVVVPVVSEFRWYTTPTGSTLVDTTYFSGSWTTPPINTTTTYYVTAFNGCESLVRTPVKAIVSPVPVLNYLPASPVSCGEDVGVEISATGDVEEVYLINEDFDSGLGTFTNTNITSSVRNADTQWQNRTSTYIPTAISGTNTWYPAIASGINGDGFAMATSDFGDAFPYVQNQIASATVSTLNFTSLTLSLRMFYSRYFIDGLYPAEEFITIDVSTNNGTNWIEIKRFTEDIGIGTKFETLTYDLSSYIGVSQLKVRVRYYNNNWCDGIAIDDVELYGNRPNVNLNWTTTLPIFTDAACQNAYDPLTTASVIYVKPTLAQLELTSFNFTVNAELDNGCISTKVITVTNNSKVWSGGTISAETQWENPANWRPNGVPSASNCIIIPDTTFDPIISGTSYDAFGKNIKVKSGGILTVNSDNNITITDEVTVNNGGLFDIKNSASLLQTNDAAINTGSIKMTRTTRAMTRFAYVYAGSPIAENAFSQIPTQFDFKYRWTSGTMNGSWVGLSALTSGEGFIARVKNIAPFSTGTGTIDFVYTGTPKNGVVNVNVDSYDSSSLVAGNTVLLANTYPSAINGSSLLTFAGNTELGGTLFFWTSVTLYSGSGPYSLTDYGSWNLSGGVGTSPSSDPTNTSLKPNGKIAAGQGFFAQAFADGQISFNDNMRVPDFNSQFFKTGNTTQSEEKNRIWLNLYSDTTFRQMLVGYLDGATNGHDRLYDGDAFTNNEINIYSLLDNRKLVIQGKALPFDENDIIPLGYKITNGGIYSIKIDELDGIFNGNQNVYLRDKLLAIDHDIKAAPYSFTTVAGTFDNRFDLVFVSNALGTNNPNEINTFASIYNNVIRIESNEFIKEISLYDIAGKLINNYSLTEIKKQFSDAFNYPNGVYIAKITLDNGIVVAKKLIH